MIIWDELPPNFEAICEVFPGASAPGVVFAFAPDIYAPGLNGHTLSPHIKAHEEVHVLRQGNNPTMWWHRYLTEDVFRLHEETLAHLAEARSILDAIGWNRKNRKRVSAIVGDRIAAPLYKYDSDVTGKKCEKLIYHLLTKDTDECCGQGCDEVFK